MFRTEFEFSLPLGYVDSDGSLYRDGVMRLATAADEILPVKDPRVRSNEAYLAVIILSRVITRLGPMDNVTPGVVEKLFAADMAYLQKLYNGINRPHPVVPEPSTGAENGNVPAPNGRPSELEIPGGSRLTPVALGE